MFHALRISLATLTLSFFATPAFAQFEELLAKVPPSANAIVLLDGEKVWASPLAEKEGWKKNYEQAFAAGLVTLTPDTKQMVFASQIDFQSKSPKWELVLVDFAEEHPIATIARNTKGTLDKFDDAPAVLLDDDSYCVQLGPKRLAVMGPANRQTVNRWLRSAKASTAPAIAPFLKNSISALKTSQLVVAFDLEDAVPPDVVKAKLAGSSALAGKKIDLDAAAEALASVRGMVFEVAVTGGSYGRLRVQFNQDASILGPYAKPLTLEIFTALGIMIDDLNSWEAETGAKEISLHGKLSETGRKRIMALIDHPTAALIATNNSESRASTAETNKMAYGTLQYFKAIDSLITELRGKDIVTFGQQAAYMDQWARKIDRLPMLNVDPDMLGYGRYVSQRLRDISAALRGIGISSHAASAQVYTMYTAGGNPDGNYAAAERRAISAQARATGATTARAIAAEMENQSADVRKAMTQKYQMNF